MLKALRSPQFVHDFTLGIMPLLFGFNLLTSIGFLPHALHGKGDFRQLYAAGYMVRTGYSHELYNYEAQERFQNQVVSRQAYALPFIRPASQALLFAPLTKLSYPVAYSVFAATNIGLLAACFFLLRLYMRNLAVHSRWNPITIFVTFTPLAYAITQGQDTILLLTVLTTALLLLQRRTVVAAGMLTGLGSFKFQLAVPIFVLFACWRRWKFCAGFLMTAVGLAALSILVTGPQQAVIYVRSLLAFGAGKTSQANLLHYAPGIQVGVMPNLHGLVHAIVTLPSAGLVAFIAGGLGFTVWLCRRGNAWPIENQLLLAMGASVVLSYYAFMGDLAVLLPPLTSALYLSASNANFRARSFLPLAALLTLLAPACLWFFPLHFYIACVPVLLLLVAIAISRLDA